MNTKDASAKYRPSKRCPTTNANSVGSVTGDILDRRDQTKKGSARQEKVSEEQETGSLQVSLLSPVNIWS